MSQPWALAPASGLRGGGGDWAPVPTSSHPQPQGQSSVDHTQGADLAAWPRVGFGRSDGS